ncbi:MAG: DJ-1/PfpI family protein [Oscillospiraceae bacterium]|nr:DJ-1/PfpI family protein [Oscillospiraceae bacterium]MDD4414439.1 DJ-1/PfpI family protein [Oscillospiraceae bacterium]
MVVVFLADGFEEIEALSVVDILRRAELSVVTVGIGGKTIRGSHGIIVAADIEDINITDAGLEAVVLPGGIPGAFNLENSPVVQHFLDVAVTQGLPICAICAAPLILGHRGLLSGRKAVCYPGYEQELEGARIVSDGVVVEDGQYITAKGAGVALDFAFRIVEKLVSAERAQSIRKSMQC